MITKNKKLVIVGNGETAELAYLYFTNDSQYDVVAFAVEKDYIVATKQLGLDVVPIENMKEIFSPIDHEAFIAVSSTKLNTLRTRLYLYVKSLGYRMASYISTRAYIGYEVEIGDNCFIMENNVIQSFAKIGNNVVLWSGNHIGHSSIIHNNVFISSHVVISGFCEVGENCFVGVNASIANNVKIGEYCLIGLGAIIAKDVESNSIMKMPYAQKYMITAKKFNGIGE